LEHLNGMHVFARVVEAGSFSEAARRLGSSKSAVSRQMSQLENRLGAQLLQRTTRKLALTEAGRLFHERCVRIIREVEAAESEVSRAQRSPRGLLRVNAPLSLGRLALAPMLPAFLARHSDLRVELALDDRRVDAVEAGFDVTVRISEQLPDSSAISRRIAPARVVVCAAPRYLARCGIPRTPADLARHECLIYSNRARWLFQGPAGDEWTDVSGRLRANDADTLREAVLAGLGLAQVPRFIVADDLARAALRIVLEPFEARSAWIWALYSPTRHLSAKVRAFVDFLAEQLAPKRQQRVARE